MKKLLNDLYQHRKLTQEEAKKVLIEIASGEHNNSQIASFLTVFIMRGIELNELAGFRDALLELCVDIDLSEFNAMDLCGTGGDGKDTFNISTTTSFVVAATGTKVAKHGNYGVSSISGSSSVIEHFGYQFTNDKDEIRRKIDKSNICYLHAPLFHPAMKNVGPVRKEMGVKTFFNMLGPISNPARVKKQITGTFNLEIARLYGYLMEREDKQYCILHALDGYDEISLTGATKVLTNGDEKLITPQQMGLPTLQADDIKGGKTVAESATIFKNILQGKGTSAQQTVVTANAAMALRVDRPEMSMSDAVGLAKETIESGKGWKTFETFLNA